MRPLSSTSRMLPAIGGLCLLAMIAGCDHQAGTDPGVGDATAPARATPPAVPADEPIEGFRSDLLDLAFETASTMPLGPHVKNRSRAQEAVVETCLELDQPQRALGYVEQIDNWRRGAGYAELALYCAARLRRAGPRAARPRGRAGRADRGLAPRPDPGQDRQDARRARAGPAGRRARDRRRRCGDRQAGRDEGRGRGRRGIRRAARGHRATPRIGSVRRRTQRAGVEHRALRPLLRRRGAPRVVEETIRSAWDPMPLFVRIDLLLRMADSALDHGDQGKALQLVDDAQAIKDSAAWPAEHAVPLAARLAGLRYRAGDVERARADADAALALFVADREQIVEHLPRRGAAPARRGVRGDGGPQRRARGLRACDRGERGQPQLAAAGRGPLRDVPVDGPARRRAERRAVVAASPPLRGAGRSLVRRSLPVPTIMAAVTLAHGDGRGAAGRLHPRRGLRQGLRRRRSPSRRCGSSRPAQRSTASESGHYRVRGRAARHVHAGLLQGRLRARRCDRRSSSSRGSSPTSTSRCPASSPRWRSSSSRTSRSAARTRGGLLHLRFESPALMDSISSDLMSRAGASDAASALRLVAGATVQDGKSAVIRGLPDRYVSSQLNGVRLPTADEDKRAVELDQFPSAVIESIQVSKTFTPDQQGDASGGAVNVRAQGHPDGELHPVQGPDRPATRQVTSGRRLPHLRRRRRELLGQRRRRPRHPVREPRRQLGRRSRECPAATRHRLQVVGRRRRAARRSTTASRSAASRSFFYERDASYFDDGIDDDLLGRDARAIR